jgi:hypothetical protein
VTQLLTNTKVKLSFSSVLTCYLKIICSFWFKPFSRILLLFYDAGFGTWALGCSDNQLGQISFGAILTCLILLLSAATGKNIYRKKTTNRRLVFFIYSHHLT